jgi:hypothetical protein
MVKNDKTFFTKKRGGPFRDPLPSVESSHHRENELEEHQDGAGPTESDGRGPRHHFIIHTIPPCGEDPNTTQPNNPKRQLHILNDHGILFGKIHPREVDQICNFHKGDEEKNETDETEDEEKKVLHDDDS